MAGQQARLTPLLLALLGASELLSPPQAEGLAMLVGEQAQDLAACHAQHADGSFWAFELGFRARPGRVWFPRLVTSTVDDGDLERCVRKAARGWAIEPTVTADLSWPLLILPAPATLYGAQPTLPDPALSAWIAGLQGELMEQAQGSDVQGSGEGVLVFGLELQGTTLGTHAMRDTSADQSLGEELLPPLTWRAVPDLEAQAVVAVSRGALPEGRAPRDNQIAACLQDGPATLDVVLRQGRVVAAWGDACLAQKALGWQLDPALTGALEWTLSPPAADFLRPVDPVELPTWEEGGAEDLQGQMAHHLAYYRAQARSCFDAPGEVIVAVDLRYGESENPRVVGGNGTPAAEACVLAQAAGWRWPITLEGTRRVRVSGP